MRRQRFLLFRVYRFQDTQAYAELYDLYYKRIRRFVFFKLPTNEDVDEMTSEVFLRGWEYATASRVENVGALFYRIARNLVADFYRTRYEEDGLDSVAELSSDEEIEKDLAIKEEYKELVKSIRKLREDYCEVLIMKYLDEMSTKEIASALEKTPNNVRVLLFRAKKALKDIT